MKILLVSPLPPPAGGIAYWTANFLKFFSNLPHSISLLDTSVTGTRKKHYSKRFYFEEVDRLIVTFQRLRILLKSKYDICHLNTSCAKVGIIRDYYIIKAAKKKNVPVVVHFHCNVPDAIRTKIQRKYLRKICKISNGLFCLNETSFDYLNNITDKKVFIVNNFLTQVQEKQQTRTINDSITQVLFVGHATIKKGALEFIETAKYFPQINFNIVGHVDEDISSVEVTKNVRFFGEVSRSEVISYMQMADVLLFPSHSEGFPLVILEAMSTGLPIITTKVGSIGHILNEDAIYVKIGDLEDIRAALQLSMSKEIRISISNKIVEKVKEYYPEKVINSILEKYLLISGKNENNN